MKDFIILFIQEYISPNDNKLKRSITSRPKKMSTLKGIDFSIGTIIPGEVQPAITTGFANDVTDSQWLAFNNAFPEGHFHYNPKTDEALSVTEFKEKFATSSKSPQQPSQSVA